MSHFFIDRPIFAWVIAIIIMLSGVLGITTLPVAQYPDIAPPEISIASMYSGATAKTVEDSVTQIIEQQMTGIDNLNYMYSTSESSGRSEIHLSFKPGTDSDIAQMQVQNKLSLVTAMLPEVVQRNGIQVRKSSASFFLIISLVNTDDTMTFQDLGDYAVSHMQDALSRVDGVGELMMFGSQYSMRIWTDPAKLYKYNMNVSDVISAVNAQNNDINAGAIGGAPAVDGQMINYTVSAQSRLSTVEQFENIILRTNEDGSVIKLKDIAWMELAGEENSYMSRFSGTVADDRFVGRPAAGIALRLASGANAISTGERVKAKMQELDDFFPSNIEWVVAYDTTPFVKESLYEVFKTLGEAILLVFVIMYLFLQDFRATVIPTIAVPVVLLGTFAVMAMFGFSINTLTLFGMVLAIGLLVDDAIVVVENVERIMHDEHLGPRDAARKSMTQITGALVGIGLVLSAVFIPMAFFGGSTGVIYRQFSITIVSAMVLSVVVALILTPSLCVQLMKPATDKKASGGGASHQQGFFGKFNRGFERFTNWYANGVEKVLHAPKVMMLAYLGMIILMGGLFMVLPTGFLPDEDQGILMATVQLPEGASFERTLKVIEQAENYFMNVEEEAVQSTMAVVGFSFAGGGQNTGMIFVRLKEWNERNKDHLKAQAVADRANGTILFSGEGLVYTLLPPPIMELGTASGFDMELMDNGGLGYDDLVASRNYILTQAASKYDHKLANVRHNGLDATTEYRLRIDWDKAMTQKLLVEDINSTLGTLWGAYYINNFVDRGRTKKVKMQAESQWRMLPEDFNRIYIRNTDGKMVPFSSFSTGEWIKQPPRLERYNGVSSMEIQGVGLPGVSSGEAMTIMETISKDLPKGMNIAWTGLSFQEKQAGAQAPMLYAISLLVVFLCLAALYESWSIPFSVMLVVPLGVLGALVVACLRGMYNDVYFQVGLLTIVGLSAKNAILIVEFAKDLEEQGMELIAATVEACRLRLRPILMTSLAFMLGVTPLAVSSGAGSAGQNAIGTGVLGGMTTATVLGIYYIPLFFVIVSRLFKVNVHVREQQPEHVGGAE